MPGSGAHTTIIQHLAQENEFFQSLLGNPNLNQNWATYRTDAALLNRYSILGAMGPDVFYAMLDYGGDIQEFENAVITIAATFECVGEVIGEVNNIVTNGLNTLTYGVWEKLEDVISNVKGILEGSVFDFIIDEHNFWSWFTPLRQVDDFEHNWYWADFLHYVKTGCFAKTLLDMAPTYSSDPRTTSFLKAYAAGYLTHYVSDTVGHAYVNRIVQSPWRNFWQRHHLVENFIDAYVWDKWHAPTTMVGDLADEAGLDQIVSQAVADNPARTIGMGQPLTYARLNDLCNIGSAGFDDTIDAAIESVCQDIQSGLFKVGLSAVPSLATPDDPAFLTWCQFMADAIWRVYPPSTQHPVKLASSNTLQCASQGYPTAQDIAGAYGAYRIVESLATENEIDQPELPNILGDISTIINNLWSQIQSNFGSIPPPPSIPNSGSVSLQSIWNAIKSYVTWLGQVLGAVLETAGDVILAWINLDNTIDADEVLVVLYLVNSALFALYHSVRMPLVMSAYSVPLTEDLTATWSGIDLTTLWKIKSADTVKLPPFPIEPVISERDLTSNSAHPFSPYRPYFVPSTMSPVNVEQPSITHPAQLLSWTTPDNMLESPLGTDVMLSAEGPAPPTTAPIPSGILTAAVSINLETFDGSQRFFGGIFANCEAALNIAIPYLNGIPLPAGTVFPDYNLDSDRGYAWPCWDVDWATGFPWNGCDPFPADTLSRVNVSALQGGIDWGQPPPPVAPGLNGTDPTGAARNGTAFVNATALSTPGDCAPGALPFPLLTVDPNASDVDLDPCAIAPLLNPASPTGNLTFDYQFAPAAFLEGATWDFVTNPSGTVNENEGRLIQFLRAQTLLVDSSGNPDPLQVLANATTLMLNGTATLDGGSTHVSPPVPADAALMTAMAQLAVTGRGMFTSFQSLVPQDSDVINKVNQLNPGAGFSPSSLAATAKSALDAAYTALWAVRANDPGWRAFRSTLGWIAVSGIDDTPHRPVNVPTSPYPQFDVTFSVSGLSTPITTRCQIASAQAWIGPNDPNTSSFTDPDTGLLRAPASGSFSNTPAPRTIPPSTPSIPAGNSIIIYIHGGGSRAEEAVGLANWLIHEGNAVGQDYTVISFDLPNSAYATTYEVTEVVGPSYDPSQMAVLAFEQAYIKAFVDALDQQLGDVKSNIVAVMGGSLGGNMSALLSSQNDSSHQYLNTIVAWSVTSIAPSTDMGFIPNGPVAAYVGGLASEVTSAETPSTESSYISNMYFQPLVNEPLLPFVPAQPIMWYRAPDWQPCKASFTSQSRFDRYEIYSQKSRHWTCAVDLELVYLSFQDDCRYQSISASPTSHLLLASGSKDNYDPVDIYNSTLDVARMMSQAAHGKAEFWLDTGHSLHDERPHLWAKEIVYFLTNLDASDSPNGTPGAPAPAPPSETDQ